MKNVLLLLHSAELQHSLSSALKDYSVTACTPADAAEVLARLRPNALILDLALPGIDGFTLLRHCRKLLPAVVLPLSEYVDDQVWMDAISLGASFVIQKPATTSYILQALTYLTNLYQDREYSDLESAVKYWIGRFSFQVKAQIVSTFCVGVLAVASNPDIQFMKQLYPLMCREYNGSEGTIDQAFRRILRDAWSLRSERADIWHEVFPNYTKCPTNRDFIFTLARFLREKYRKCLITVRLDK